MYLRGGEPRWRQGRREEAQCQSGQLDGNKAVVDGAAADPHAARRTPRLSLHKQTHTHALLHLTDAHTRAVTLTVTS